MNGFPTPNPSALTGYTSAIIGFINSALVPTLIAIAFIAFLWGVASAYILNPGDETKREEGHKFILWGVVGFVVIFSVWGLVNLVRDTLGLYSGVAPTPPGAPQASGGSNSAGSVSFPSAPSNTNTTQSQGAPTGPPL